MLIKNRFALVSLFLLLFVGCISKNDNSFRISGKVSNLKNKHILFSKIEDIQKKKTILIDTIIVNEGGEFNATYSLEPNIYTLTFDDKKTIQLAVNKGQNIVLEGDRLDKINVSGSIDTQLLNDYEAFRKASLNRLVNSVRSKIKELKKEDISAAKISKLRELEVNNYKKHIDELISFIKDKMGTSIAIYPTSIRWSGNNLPFLIKLVSDFEETNATIEITQKLKDRIRVLQKTSIGSFISTIEMPNESNEMVELTAIKGVYTLIDFWASWCPPCRTESELLNNLYNSYNSKGFEIYGISLDSNKDRWLNAIEKDNRIWTNVSTSEGFRTPVAQEYGITALPTNFLINSNGEIIAVNIHGKELKEKITSLFSI
jgi:thiol-disulfide isomerase/thioredoxin